MISGKQYRRTRQRATAQVGQRAISLSQRVAHGARAQRRLRRKGQKFLGSAPAGAKMIAASSGQGVD